MANGSLVRRAPAKINLYLGVQPERDERGYHRVDSVMAALDLCDVLEFEPADRLAVDIDTAPGLPNEKNSVYRAALALAEALDRKPAVHISVTKRIPLCAGLGGPSTDAACALLGLCELWGVEAAAAPLDKIARSIGADVPFFLHESPSFYVGGGDVYKEGFAPMGQLPVVLVKGEDARVSTVDAYRTFDADPVPAGPLDSLLDALRADDTSRALSRIFNNLAPVARKLEPQVAQTLDWLRSRSGVRVADVCGSGACTFAICDSASTADLLARSARIEFGWWSAATHLM